MKVIIQSRARELDRTKCVANAGGQFYLVHLAAARARQILDKGVKDGKPIIQTRAAMTALLEIQSGEFDT